MIRDNDKIFAQEFNQMHEWLDNQYKMSRPIIYSSVDVRHSEHKYVPVDTNLFPAGFNNFNSNTTEKGAIFFRDFMSKNFHTVKNISIIAEFHTRNLYYLSNISTLKNLVIKAGYNVELSFIDTDTEHHLNNADNSTTHISYLKKHNNKVTTSTGFIPDLILLNNDLTSGVPEIFNDIYIPIIPSIALGWHTRSKNSHFAHYRQVLETFCLAFKLDPFFYISEFMHLDGINFKEKIGVEILAQKVQSLIDLLGKKYKDYNIKDEPYVFIKADKGTYGMGIMIAKSGDDIMQMNKKMRTKMTSLKNGIENNAVIIQEGIKTIDTINNDPCERLLYLIDSKVFGVTKRAHHEKNIYESLNSTGMYFSEMLEKDEFSYATEIIARIATIAASKE